MKFILLIIFIVFGLLALATIFLSRGLVYAYVTRIKNEKVANVVQNVHFIVSLLIGFFLPNNFLSSFKLFDELYESNGLYILASIFIVFVAFLLAIGLLLNVVLKLLGFETKKPGEKEMN